MIDPTGRIVNHAIDFDRKAQARAVEIQDITSGRMLAAKLEAPGRRRKARHRITSGRVISLRSFRASLTVRPGPVIMPVPLHHPADGPPPRNREELPPHMFG